MCKCIWCALFHNYIPRSPASRRFPAISLSRARLARAGAKAEFAAHQLATIGRSTMGGCRRGCTSSSRSQRRPTAAAAADPKPREPLEPQETPDVRRWQPPRKARILMLRRGSLVLGGSLLAYGQTRQFIMRAVSPHRAVLPGNEVPDRRGRSLPGQLQSSADLCRPLQISADLSRQRQRFRAQEP